MRKQNNQPELHVNKTPFLIFQFVKLEGIRSKKKYESDRFISPIFGSSVKDVVAVPFMVKDTGDTIRRFDAFRTKHKLSESEAKEKYGSKYYEFTNIVSHKTREEYFGESDYTPRPEPKKKEPVKASLISPIGAHYVDKTAGEAKANPFVRKAKPQTVDMKPEIEEQETSREIKPRDESPTFSTFSRKQFSKPEVKDVISSNFGGGTTPEEENIENDFVEEVNRKSDDKVHFEYHQPSYTYPDVRMFAKKERDLDEKPQWLLDQIDVINATLEQFGIDGSVNGSKKGPTVTRYEIALEPGVNVKRVSNISDNLMMSLASKSLRIEAPIPGKPYVGLEVPNVKPEIVAFGNVVDTDEFLNDKDHPLKVALGVDIDGENIYVDIQSMPHGLIAGATNSGKSVCVNTILSSLLLKNAPEDLRLILIDPKMVELSAYNDLPHLITPVITDAKMAAQALNWATVEMDKRYQKFARSRSRDIKGYNQNIKRGIVEGDKMPYIVIVIDELADLMMISPHEVEDAIQRITQKARAAGIHLLVATQRPTTDVVKGTIKSNIPARIAFRVASFVDSTTILDGAGAESLLGKGDMLLKRSDRTHRLQGAYIPDDEIYKITDFIRERYSSNYTFAHEDLKRQVDTKEIVTDELFDDVAYYVVESDNASINNIQKQFEIGFNRAQKLVEMLEYYQIVSESQGTKARDVLVTVTELQALLNKD